MKSEELKKYYIRLHNSVDHTPVEGTDLIDAATKLYEIKSEQEPEGFMIGIIGEGYEAGTSPEDEDNIYYFSNSLVASNAGDHIFAKRLDEYTKEVISED
jgi:hypothetical protein